MPSFQEQVEGLFSTGQEDLSIKAKGLEDGIALLQKEVQDTESEETDLQVALLEVGHKKRTLQVDLVSKKKALSKLINLEVVLQEFQEALK